MDKRFISSIHTNMAKLDKKIEANEAEHTDLKNRREKFQEMLAMLQPEQPEAEQTAQERTPEVSNEQIPHFLKGQKHA